MSSAEGRGLSKEEVRKALAAGYSMPLEELDPFGSSGGHELLVRYDIAAINEANRDRFEEMPSWQQKLEQKLDEYRLRQQQRDREEWEILLDALTDFEWDCIWEDHNGSARIATEYRELVAKGLLG